MKNDKKARIIAFYLPQFYPIPENDKYWGKGFTEWTNVAKAKPLFIGHYQPKLPRDLGFYDLRIPEVREAQAIMARNAGIEGFMYWHYWFGNGKRVLDMPFSEVLKTGRPDFPFCLGWANHTWSNNSWTKGKTFVKDRIIFEQTYPGEEDYRHHFRYCLPAFRDHRYITVDGKPIFVIYKTTIFQDVSNFINIWRELATENGLKGLHFVGMVSSRTSIKGQELLDLGFDALNYSNYNQWNAETKLSGSIFLKRSRSFLSQKFNLPLQRYNYKRIIKYLCSTEEYKENVYPTIIPGYDRSPRAGLKAIVYYNNTPALFDKHVKNTLACVNKKEDEHKVVFLKSWNEWGEGNYMEPDLKYGHSYLNVLKSNVLV